MTVAKTLTKERLAEERGNLARIIPGLGCVPRAERWVACEDARPNIEARLGQKLTGLEIQDLIDEELRKVQGKQLVNADKEENRKELAGKAEEIYISKISGEYR